jgi:hypothetical protein
VNYKPIRQNLRVVNLRKVPAIKEEVEKFLNVGFIYLVPLNVWVSNPVPVDTKKGITFLCMYFRDLNKECPKDNFPTPFIDQILDECARSKVFYFMDEFSGYNQIQIKPKDKKRWCLFVLGVPFHTEKSISALKMLEQPSNVP